MNNNPYKKGKKGEEAWEKGKEKKEKAKQPEVQTTSKMHRIVNISRGRRREKRGRKRLRSQVQTLSKAKGFWQICIICVSMLNPVYLFSCIWSITCIYHHVCLKFSQDEYLEEAATSKHHVVYTWVLPLFNCCSIIHIYLITSVNFHYNNFWNQHLIDKMVDVFMC